jgi:structural maintenance of chromosome 4
MNKAVSAILKASHANGELSNAGILGRLGDLATIDAKYDIAISTSCGMLDHIVVHTTSGAQRCLDFLRRHNLGRASFIPLDKAPKGAHDRVVETPEGAPRLFDLITPTNFSATPALFLGIGNTLVSNDLETATRWAFDFSKRWRVVTLDGNLIESSGTMQGGGNTVKRGGMKLNGKSQNTSIMNLQSQDDCEKLEMEAKTALDNLKKCRDTRTALTEEMRELNKQIKQLSVKIPKLGLEISSCDTTRSELTQRIPELREQCVLSVSDEQKLVELNVTVSKAKSNMASCALRVSRMESEIARLQKAIIDAGGSVLKNQQQACERALSELNNAVKDLNSSKVTLSSCRKAAEKAIHNRSVAEKELSKCDESLEKLLDDLGNLEKDAMDVMVIYEHVKKMELEKRDELESLHAEYEELKKVHSKVKCVELELISKMDQCTKAVKEYEKNIHLWEVEISKLNDEHAADAEYDVSDDEEEEQESGTDTTRKLPVFSTAALSHYDVNEVKRDITVLEKERDVLAKNANMGAIAEYRKKEEDYLARYDLAILQCFSCVSIFLITVVLL